jgi:hypothetical protein
MGTLRYTVGQPGRTGSHQGTGIVLGKVRTSGAPTTSGSAADLTGLTINPGELFVGVASDNTWVNPYGTAVVGTGIWFQAGVLNAFEFDPASDGNGAKAGRAVSAIEG